MDSIFVGIDVSKDRLDVALRPGGEVFAVERNAAGLETLAKRLTALSPHVVKLRIEEAVMKTLTRAPWRGVGDRRPLPKPELN